MKKIMWVSQNPDLPGTLVNKFWDRLNESNHVNPDMDQDKGSAWNPTLSEVDGLLEDKPSPGDQPSHRHRQPYSCSQGRHRGKNQ